MIDQLSETEILDYLMSSEFEEGLTPDEFKFLLKKFRNFYRIVSCSVASHKERMEKALSDSESVKNEMIKKDSEFEIEKLELEKRYIDLVEKKLTWQERFKGKIILQDENK
jgi:hypothetical protein